MSPAPAPRVRRPPDPRIGGRGTLARRRLLPILLALIVSSCASRPEGRLELSLRIAPEDMGGFERLELDPDWAGASRHRHRDAGWRRIPLERDALALTARSRSDGGPVAAGSLPAGRYDRVLISTPIASGLDAAGHRQELISHIEPIARGFELRAGATTHVAIELVVRPSTVEDGRSEVFVKHAAVEPPSAGRETGG